MKKFFALLAVLALSYMMVLSCSDYDDETYHLEGIDKQAADLFNATVVYDTTRDDDSVITQIDTIIAPSDTVQFYSQYDLGFDSSEIPAVTIKDSLSSETFDSPIVNNISVCYMAKISGDKVSYIRFNKSNTKTLVVYFDDYVNAEFVIADSGSESVIKPSSSKIEQAAIAGCRAIKTRLEFSLSSREYLMKIVADDKTVQSNFRMVLIEK